MMDEEAIRQDERERVARHLTTVARDQICDPSSDGIDGFVAACILELAVVIRDALKPEDAA